MLEPEESIATWDIVPEELVCNAMEVIVRLGSRAVQEKIIVVVLVRLLFSGEFKVTVPESAKGIVSSRIISITSFFMAKLKGCLFKYFFSKSY